MSLLPRTSRIKNVNKSERELEDRRYAGVLSHLVLGL